MAEKEFTRTPPISTPSTVYSPIQRDGRDEKAFDPYRNVYMKELYSDSPTFERRPTMRSIASTTVADTPRYAFTIREEEELLPPRRERATVCGLRRRIFYPMLACGLLLVVGLVVGLTVGATVGKVLGSGVEGDKVDLNPVPLPPSEMPPLEESPSDPMPGSPIAAAAAVSRPGTALSDQQSFRLYYQQLDGAIQEIRYDSPGPGWQNSTTAFTEARNNTGLAAFEYLDGLERNGFVIYIDSDDVIRGKRKPPFQEEWEDSVSLQDGKFTVNGSTSEDGNQTALGLAAVYSTDFRNGPGARVFFHAQTDDDSDDAYVQELIWDQTKDSWSLGSRIRDAVPNSQLAATIDGQILRLFYCSGNGTLQEAWMNMTDPRGSYIRGIAREGTMVSDDSAITALTVEGSTLVYFSDVRAGIRELNITGAPNATDHTATLNPSTIATADSEQALLSLGAVTVPSPEGIQQIQVFHSDRHGAVDEGASVSVIAHITRKVSDPEWPSSSPTDLQHRLPLGGESEDGRAPA